MINDVMQFHKLLFYYTLPHWGHSDLCDPSSVEWTELMCSVKAFFLL